MPVATKKGKRVARKTASPAKPKVEAKVLPESRLKARERNVESRSRAVREAGVKPSSPRVEIYKLKNRSTGEVRTLIDARGDGSVADLPWLVTNGTATVGFRTRKELGQRYSDADLFAASKKPAAKKGRAKRVAKAA